jgi:hypothetical protein
MGTCAGNSDGTLDVASSAGNLTHGLVGVGGVDKALVTAVIVGVFGVRLPAPIRSVRT